MLRRGLLLACLISGFMPFAARAAVFYPVSFTLANGLQIIVVPNHLSPAVSQMVWYKVGSSDEAPGKSGLAHYLEHLMFRGTTTMAPGDFSKIIAAQGGEDNAFTSYDYTAFYEVAAADRLPMIMKMEADRMQNLHITPETATPELSVVLNERQERTDNNPAGKFEEKIRHMLMPNYPYGIPVIGWKAEMEKMTPTAADQFYRAHYAPNNAVVIISGDVVPEKVMQLAEAAYGSVPRRDVAERRPIPSLQDPSTRRFEMVDIGIEQPQLEWDAAMPSYSTQKGHEAYALELLSEILDSGEVGILYRDLVVKQGIASAVNSNYDPDSRGEAIFAIELTPSPGKDPKTLEKALNKELQAIAQQGIDEKTVTEAKERLQRDAVLVRDGIIMPGYAFGMALTTGHAVSDVEEWPERINAVTAEDVNAALRLLTSSPRSVTGLLLPDPHATAAQREAAQHLSHDTNIR